MLSPKNTVSKIITNNDDMMVKSNGNDEYHESKIINELWLEDSEFGIVGKCVINDGDIIMKINRNKNVNEENKKKIGY